MVKLSCVRAAWLYYPLIPHPGSDLFKRDRHSYSQQIIDIFSRLFRQLRLSETSLIVVNAAAVEPLRPLQLRFAHQEHPLD